MLCILRLVYKFNLTFFTDYILLIILYIYFFVPTSINQEELPFEITFDEENRLEKKTLIILFFSL